MLIGKQFVFAHLPKCGGFFMQQLIRAHFPVLAAWEGNESHRSLELLPDEHRDKPVFALLRNPWAWYVSWFAFCAERRDNEEFLRNYVAGDSAFRQTIGNLLAPGHSDPVINEFMRRENIGLLEMHRYHIMDLEEPAHDITYGRLESLQEDFPAFLAAHGIAMPPGLGDALGAKPANRSAHGPWQDYYDAELTALVAEKERRIIRLGGYGR